MVRVSLGLWSAFGLGLGLDNGKERRTRETGMQNRQRELPGRAMSINRELGETTWHMQTNPERNES